MPSIEIDYKQAKQTLAFKEEPPLIVSTSQGKVLLEIQGELILPSSKPEELTPEEEAKYVLIDEIHQAAKIGRLQFEGKKATLYIGTSQRLLGDVKSLNPPLGLLKFPQGEKTGEKVQMVDVIKNKVIFNGRPLPIM